MTECEWLVCTDTWPMFVFMRATMRDRKMRLWKCAIVRRVLPLIPHQEARQAVERAERYADGLVNRRELDAAWQGEWASLRTRSPYKNYVDDLTSAQANAVVATFGLMGQSDQDA